MVLQTLGYPACRECDLAGNEILAAALRLVVEEYAVYREHTVSLAVLFYHPEAVLLSDGIGAVRVERRSFALGNFLYLAVKLRGRSLIYLGLFSMPSILTASSILSTPIASTSPEYSGTSNDT